MWLKIDELILPSAEVAHGVDKRALEEALARRLGQGGRVVWNGGVSAAQTRSRLKSSGANTDSELVSAIVQRISTNLETTTGLSQARGHSTKRRAR